MVGQLRDKAAVASRLGAPTGATAAHAAVAASVADHDGSAGVAAGSVSHVVHTAHGVGGVVDTAIRKIPKPQVLRLGPPGGLAQDDRVIRLGL